MSMIQEKQLKDDNDRLFGFGTHMFRHYYGVKLTEMHLDDWTIARLLGHKRVSSVKHYRKMSNLMWDSAMAENGILKVGRVTDFQAHQMEHQLEAYTDCNHG